VEHTIVVFGSTRLPEPEAAQRKVNAARAALKADSDNVELQRRLAVAKPQKEIPQLCWGGICSLTITGFWL